MNSTELLKYIIFGAAGLFALIVFIYMILRKKLMGKNTRYIAQLTEGTKQSSFSMEVFYQKFYIQAVRIPLLKRYALKLRRRLEIINLEDEYLTRKQTARILLRAILIVIPLTILIILVTLGNLVLVFALLLLLFVLLVALLFFLLVF